MYDVDEVVTTLAVLDAITKERVHNAAAKQHIAGVVNCAMAYLLYDPTSDKHSLAASTCSVESGYDALRDRALRLLFANDLIHAHLSTTLDQLKAVISCLHRT